MEVYNKVQFGVPLRGPPFNPVTKVIVRKIIEHFFFKPFGGKLVAHTEPVDFCKIFNPVNDYDVI